MNKFPAGSTATPGTNPIWAVVAGPPSPLKLGVPFPAIVVMIPVLASMRLRRSLVVSGMRTFPAASTPRSEDHTSELQSHSDLVCRLLLEKKKKTKTQHKRTKIGVVSPAKRCCTPSDDRRRVRAR